MFDEPWDDDDELATADAQRILDAIDDAWVVSADVKQRIRSLFLAKLAAKYPDHPWTRRQAHDDHTITPDGAV